MVAGKSKPQPSPPTHFPHAATKLAVAQICRSAGFKRCHPSALDALARISSFYLHSIARSAASFASFAGRTHSNLLDVVSAFDELASPLGFPGASRPTRCLLKSGTLRDLRSFVRVKAELPFAHPMAIRRGDHESEVSSANSGSNDDRRRRLEIPPWLPEFPDLRDGNEDRVRSELYWEDMSVEEGKLGEKPELGLWKVVDKRRKMLPLRRDRVKFRVMGKEKWKTKVKT